MAWLAVDSDNREWVFSQKPTRMEISDSWESKGIDYYSGSYYLPSIQLPKGSIKKLIGRNLNWEDEPVEI